MRGEKSGAEVVETRTHLYRYPLGKNAASSSPSTKPSANAGTLSEKKQSDWAVGWTSDPKHLFRFSSLTFNTHRIHWDRDYCVNVEKREGLIVHGPLTALLSVHHANDAAVKQRKLHIKSFEYRNTSPMVVGTPIEFCGRWTGEKTAEVWVSQKDSPPTFLSGRCNFH